jgi:hypothetical protein
MTVQEYLSSTELISMKMICIMIVHVKGLEYYVNYYAHFL